CIAPSIIANVITPGGADDEDKQAYNRKEKKVESVKIHKRSGDRVIERCENKRPDADQRGTQDMETNLVAALLISVRSVREASVQSVAVLGLRSRFKRALASASRADTPASPGAQPQGVDRKPRTFLADESAEQEGRSD